ncbi:MAG: transporter [Aeromicrobium sp.]|uniref:monovalent cation/H+ antiporter complex subunit F n=1 Tax=Aeromicrobium sp. TaxID=1871063 RepID=UPI0026172941|nr:monovalent cation/H+ antiporter complex subunit F [Aeromicrobium sp.]MDF1705680.1 transporter [Aeromicrobium sp.]
MTGLVVAAVVVLLLSSAVGTALIVRGGDDATRAVVGDLLFFCATGVFILVGVLSSTSVLYDVALLATLCGILATAALARMLTRGDR